MRRARWVQRTQRAAAVGLPVGAASEAPCVCGAQSAPECVPWRLTETGALAKSCAACAALGACWLGTQPSRCLASFVRHSTERMLPLRKPSQPCRRPPEHPPAPAQLSSCTISPIGAGHALRNPAGSQWRSFGRYVAASPSRNAASNIGTAASTLSLRPHRRAQRLETAMLQWALVPPWREACPAAAQRAQRQPPWHPLAARAQRQAACARSCCKTAPACCPAALCAQLGTASMLLHRSLLNHMQARSPLQRMSCPCSPGCSARSRGCGCVQGCELRGALVCAGTRDCHRGSPAACGALSAQHPAHMQRCAANAADWQ